MAVYSKSGYLEMPMRASETVGSSDYSDICVFADGITTRFVDGRLHGSECEPLYEGFYRDEKRIAEWEAAWKALPAYRRQAILRFGRRLSKSLMQRPRHIGF